MISSRFAHSNRTCAAIFSKSARVMRKIIPRFVWILLNLLLLSSTSFCNKVHADNGASMDIGFLFFAPAAKKVDVIGDFNSWDPDSTPLQGPDAAGNWRASVSIPENTHSIRYAYLVDGKTVIPDPAYPAVSDDFGGKDTLRMMP